MTNNTREVLKEKARTLLHRLLKNASSAEAIEARKILMTEHGEADPCSEVRDALWPRFREEFAGRNEGDDEIRAAFEIEFATVERHWGAGGNDFGDLREGDWIIYAANLTKYHFDQKKAYEEEREKFEAIEARRRGKEAREWLKKYGSK